jgi:hypothetical protein
MKFGIRPAAFLLIASIALISACSAIKLGYNNSATFAHTYLTSKVDFDSDQSSLLKTSLVEIVEWHRNQELPLLALELNNIQQALLPRNGTVEPVTALQVQAFNQTLRNSLRRTANEAAPIIAKNMLGLWPNQVKDIQNALEKANKEYREERLAKSPELQQEKSVERMTKRFEDWLGDLNPTQKSRIEAWAQTDTSQANNRYQKRLARQQQFIALVKQASNRQIDQTTLAREVSRLLNGWQTPANTAEKNENDQRQKATIALVVDVLNLATADQRASAAERAASWAKDFQILASNS